MALVNYKCPNCGGGLKFDPATQSFECEYCLSSFTEQEMEELAKRRRRRQELRRRLSVPAPTAAQSWWRRRRRPRPSVITATARSSFQADFPGNSCRIM